MTYTVKAGQNLLEIALEQFGEVEQVFYLCRDNGLDIGADVQPGTELTIGDHITKPKIVNIFSG